jgi:hypothetical protein
MWTIVKAWLLKLILKRSLGFVLAALLVILLPIAVALKMMGVPLLVVLLIVGVPLLLLLAVIGLPMLIVAGGGMSILGMISAILGFGLALLKIVVPILLIVWLLRWLFSDRNGKKGEQGGTESGPSPDPGTGTA